MGGKSLHRQPDGKIVSPLYQMPERYRAFCEGAANAGLAKSAEEYWADNVTIEVQSPAAGERFLEMLIASIIEAKPSSDQDSRSASVRLREAMNAILGHSWRDDRNDIDDADVLRELAWHANDPNFSDENLRSATRSLIQGRLRNSTEESVVRRIVRKFRNDPASVGDALAAEDQFRDDLHRMVLRDIQRLLASIGIETRVSPPLPDNGDVNVEVARYSSSAPDENIP